MSPLFVMAADYIDRMCNPRWGSPENEEYALKFGDLLRKEGFEGTLQKEATQITDPGTLTPYGWIWLLGWARSNKIQLNPDLLFSLMDQWQSAMTMSLIIELATLNENPAQNGFVTLPDGKKFTWTNALLYKCISIENRKTGENQQTTELPDIKYIQNVLLALIQAGNTLSLEAAGALLRIDWAGQNILLRFFSSQLELLDEETRELWIRRLRPPGMERLSEA